MTTTSLKTRARQLFSPGLTARICLITIAFGSVLLSGSAPTATEDDQSEVARFEGEELFYSLEFFGTELARGALIMGEIVDTELGPVLPVSGLAITEGLAALVYPMRDEGNTVIDAISGLARTSEKELDEQGQRRTYRVDFRRAEYAANVTRVRDDITNRYERVLPSNTHDAFSWVYAIREQNLIPGSTQVYFIYDGWKLSRVTATVTDGEDRILVGEEFIRCRRINLYREVLDSTRPLPMVQESADLPPSMWVRATSSGEQVGNLWISNDDRRLPVQIDFANQLVTVVARLSQHRDPSNGY